MAGGYPDGGTLPQVPPCHTWLGGTPTGGGYPTSYRITDGVLDTPRSECLLRWRRRTFLFISDIDGRFTWLKDDQFKIRPSKYIQPHNELFGFLVCIIIDDTRTELWSKSGDSGDEWHQAVVTFTPHLSYHLIFEGEVGSGQSSDAALDDIDICLTDVEPGKGYILLFCDATDIPVLNFWYPGFQTQGGLPSLCASLLGHNGLFRFTSSVTPAKLLTVYCRLALLPAKLTGIRIYSWTLLVFGSDSFPPKHRQVNSINFV